jgi:2-polyprenyl-3-methyl-5-hydroxy-6-metoxy-1,4-benzoquinol methylase
MIPGDNMNEYNITQLNPDTTFERHVFHRDQFAHYLRWTHALKLLKIGMKVLDFGSGSGNMAEVMYRNRYKGERYLGLEYRQRTVDNANEKFKDVNWIEFKQQDLTINFFEGNDWDMITCFEVIEHINKKNVEAFLKNLALHCNASTTVLLSTPVYNEKVGAAGNHIIDGVVQEFTFNELKNYLEKFFIVEKVFGTFASQRDYKDVMSEVDKIFFNQAKEYFDSNILSCLMAFKYPEQSRNCLWRLRVKP